MTYRGDDSERRDPWQHLYAHGSRMRPPNRPVLTADGPFGRHRPDPEIIEHMLDDLESRMRNYFLLYNRERDMRKKTEEHCYRLEKELADERKKLGQAHMNIDQLHAKIRSLVGHPMKIRETIDKIEVLHNQLDTLIQAFVGIGSCATLQGQNPVAFLRLFLEYLYPCRELDVRLNTLYTAMYTSLSYTGTVPMPRQMPMPAPMQVQPNMPVPARMDSMRTEQPPSVKHLTGLYILVHQLMLKKAVTEPEPNTYSCTFRYDHESTEAIERFASRRLDVDAKPLEKTTGVIEFNGCIQVEQLPPRVPNVIPRMILEVKTDAAFVGKAIMSIVDDRTLKAREPWAIVDDKGSHQGDVIVTVKPLPEGSKLPAVGFAKRYDELLLSSASATNVEKPSQFVQTVPDRVAQGRESGASTAPASPPKPQTPARTSAAAASEPPKTAPDKPFQPTLKATLRKPLILKGKAAARAKPAANEAKPTVKEEKPVNKEENPEVKEEAPVENTQPEKAAEPAAKGATKEPPPATSAEAVTKPPAATTPPEEQPKPSAPEEKAKPAAVVAPKVAAKVAPKVSPKVAPMEAPAKAPTPNVGAKVPAGSPSPITTPAPAPSPISGPADSTPLPPVVPKIAVKSKVAPTPKVKDVPAPKEVTKAAPAAEAAGAASQPKASTETPTVSVTPKAALPKLPPPAAAAPTESGGGALLPIVVKPKFIMKKPLAPKKQ